MRDADEFTTQVREIPCHVAELRHGCIQAIDLKDGYVILM